MADGNKNVYYRLMLVTILFFLGVITIGGAWWAGSDAERARQRVRLARRADQQHRWFMAGDPRGLYGDYMPPELIVEDSAFLGLHRLLLEEPQLTGVLDSCLQCFSGLSAEQRDDFDDRVK